MRQLILDTDWCTDADDAVAVKLLCELQKREAVRLLGVVIDYCTDDSVVSLDAFMRLSGLPDIPVGIDAAHRYHNDRGRYQARLAALPSKYGSNADAPDGAALYRRLLSCAEGKADIVGIGFEQVIEALLKSEPDSICPLDGMTLVSQKVGRIWLMAGRFDGSGKPEFNIEFSPDSRRAAAFIAGACPVPVTYLGFEVGKTVITGAGLPQDEPLRTVLHDHHGHDGGGSSWDPMTALLAVCGDERQAGYGFYTGTVSVDTQTGTSSFTEDPAGRHRIVYKLRPDETYAGAINKIVCADC